LQAIAASLRADEVEKVTSRADVTGHELRAAAAALNALADPPFQLAELQRISAR
jgi:hypothetical protein